ncbi:hypothetical protein [Microbacterium tumbae]
MSIATIQHQLSTPEGFAKAVTPRSTAYVGGMTSLIAGVIGLVINFVQLGSAVDWKGWLIARYFFDASALEFSSGRAQMWHFLYVYGPIVLVPLGIVLLIVHFSTRRKNGAALFADYQARGWVGRQRYSGLKVQNGRAQVDVAFISHPSIPDAELDTIAQQYNAYLATLDKKALKATAAAALKAGVLLGTSASNLSPNLPAALTAAQVQGKGEFVAVVPPADGGKKFQVLPVKE